MFHPRRYARLAANGLAVAALLSAAGAAIAASSPHPRLDAALGAFTGTALIARGDTAIWTTPRRACRPPAPGNDAIVLCHPRDPAEIEWPWASVTKQVVATLIMQEVERRTIELDAPAGRYLRGIGTGAAAPTIRQLLQHRSGLRNSNDLPDFYTAQANPLGWCLGDRKGPAGAWSYNNCDYIALAGVLDRVTRRDLKTLFAERIARPLGLTQARVVERGEVAGTLATGDPATLAGYGGGGAIVGTPRELLAFDRALMTGRLLKPATRADMWRGDAALGFMALGQWSFEAKPRGCAAPLRIIERRGAIGRAQVRNIILPDADIAIILFADDPALDFGEIWRGKGLSHDVVAAAACA